MSTERRLDLLVRGVSEYEAAFILQSYRAQRVVVDTDDPEFAGEYQYATLDALPLMVQSVEDGLEVKLKPLYEWTDDEKWKLMALAVRKWGYLGTAGPDTTLMATSNAHGDLNFMHERLVLPPPRLRLRSVTVYAQDGGDELFTYVFPKPIAMELDDDGNAVNLNIPVPAGFEGPVAAQSITMKFGTVDDEEDDAT